MLGNRQTKERRQTWLARLPCCFRSRIYMYNIYILDSEMSPKLHCKLLLTTKIPSARTTSAVCLFKEHSKNIKTLNPPQLLQLLLQVRIPPAAPLPPLHPFAAGHCGCLWSSQMRIQIQLQIQIQIQIRSLGTKSIFISFHFVACGVN